MSDSLSKFKNFFSNPKQYILPILITIPVLAIALALFFKLNSGYAKIWDKEWGFWFILITFLTGSFALIYNAKEFFQTLKKNSPPLVAWLCLVAVILFFGIFAQTQIEQQHRVLSDESSWESMGLQMYYHHSGGVCNEGWFEKETRDLTCTNVVNNFKGKATAIVYWVMYHVMEPTRDSALQLNFWLYIGSLIFLFLAVYIFTKKEYLALAITTVLAATPIYLLQSMSASTEVLYIFLFTIILLFMAIIKPDKIHWKHLAFIIPVIGIFAQTRQETIFCILPFVFYYHEFFRKNKFNLSAFTALLILASWPILNTIIAYRGYDFQGGEHAAHSIANLIFNLKSNLKIMLSLDTPQNGILKSPFYTTSTILLIAGSAWILVRAIVNKKYIWGLFLTLFFHLQSLVILVNVSGTFEIGINQRYVLIALPSFAIIIGIFIYDVLSLNPIKKMIKISPHKLAFIICAITFISLTIYHKKSFNENMLYKHNKLLTEEHFLNTYIKENTPSNSIFIYSRPWQMLCSGFNSYSERTFLGWNNKTYNHWNEFSNGNIYIVRGQDGYGKVNRKSRVVGFKTTNQIDQILEKYEYKLIIKTAKDFGYPLEIYQLTGPKKINKYIKKISANFHNFIYESGDSLKIDFIKSVPDSIKYQVKTRGFETYSNTLTQNREFISIAIPNKIKGINESSIILNFPDSTKHTIPFTWFLSTPQNALITQLPYKKISQSWGQLNIDHSVDKNPLTINKKTFKFGFGAHADSKIKVSLDGKFSIFQTYVGLDDEQSCGDGALFKVIGDNKLLAKSRQLYSHQLQLLRVNVKGVKELILETDKVNTNNCDHTNWANPWFYSD